MMNFNIPLTPPQDNRIRAPVLSYLISFSTESNVSLILPIVLFPMILLLRSKTFFLWALLPWVIYLHSNAELYCLGTRDNLNKLTGNSRLPCPIIN